MDKANTDKNIYDKNVIEFVTVAVEYCAILEKDEQLLRDEWVDRMLKILPLLYLKASLLPDTLSMHHEPPATFVREEDYVRIEAKVAAVMLDEDIYLDVFLDEMKYSERPISAFVSENIADIYQDVRNFISVYQYELKDQMNEAIYTCKENFKTYWGQKLVNVLRPLHDLKYGKSDLDDESMDFDDEINREELWG